MWCFGAAIIGLVSKSCDFESLYPVVALQRLLADTKSSQW
jgi:hypothetical protein